MQAHNPSQQHRGDPVVIDTTRLLEIASGSLAEGEQEVEDPTRQLDVSSLLEILARP